MLHVTHSVETVRTILSDCVRIYFLLLFRLYIIIFFFLHSSWCFYVFYFGGFSVHKDWLTYFDRQDAPDELYYTLSVSNKIAQTVKFYTLIHMNLRCCFFGFISVFKPELLLSKALPPLCSYDNFIGSVSICYHLNSKRDTPFHFAAYD